MEVILATLTSGSDITIRIILVLFCIQIVFLVTITHGQFINIYIHRHTYMHAVGITLRSKQYRYLVFDETLSILLVLYCIITFVILARIVMFRILDLPNSVKSSTFVFRC